MGGKNKAFFISHQTKNIPQFWFLAGIINYLPIH